MWSPSVRSKTGNEHEAAERVILKAGIETGNHKGYCNGLVKSPVVATPATITNVSVKAASLVQREPVERSTIKAGIETGNHKEYGNGIVRSFLATIASHNDLPIKAVSSVENGEINLDRKR